MTSSISNGNEIQQNVQRTFDRIYYGETNDLHCPYCLSQPLRFSYTFVEPATYGIWISCTFCAGEAHLRLREKPPGFTKEAVIAEFQKRDENAVRQTEDWWKEVSGKNTETSDN